MERQIKLEGVSNFRDLGGYEAADGRMVKWRTIFRSRRQLFGFKLAGRGGLYGVDSRTRTSHRA